MTADNEEIRRWYVAHGLPYLEEDWGLRDDTGESARAQHQEPERTVDDSGNTQSVRSVDPSPANRWWWEDKQFPWEQRSRPEQDYVEALEEFYTPYIAMLSRPKQALLYEAFFQRRQFSDIAKDERMSRQGARQATMRAVRDLTKLVAMDDPLYVPPADGRRRDYEAEALAARRVLAIYLDKKGLR
jgi:hypothetical protein